MTKKAKSPSEPILLSEDSFNWLEGMLKANDKRKGLTRSEKKLLEESKLFDSVVRTFI